MSLETEATWEASNATAIALEHHVYNLHVSFYGTQLTIECGTIVVDRI